VSDVDGYLLLDDGSVRYIGLATCEVRVGRLVLAWPPCEIRGEGTTVAIGASTGEWRAASYIEPSRITDGCIFHGSMHVTLGPQEGTPPWLPERIP
jgi:hypothetical protein